MVGGGILKKCRDDADARRVFVELTEASRQAVEHILWSMDSERTA